MSGWSREECDLAEIQAFAALIEFKKPPKASTGVVVGDVLVPIMSNRSFNDATANVYRTSLRFWEMEEARFQELLAVKEKAMEATA